MESDDARKEGNSGVLVADDGIVTPDPPYHVYSRKEKWFMVGVVGLAGLFSPLPANIYFPAIPTMAIAFHKTTEIMNQTVTAYLAMQGISPMLWGTLSDRYGRRPVFLCCFVVLIGSCVGLALCPTDAFWLLIVMRLIQASGCASTIALGAGVIGDISTPEERAGYFGMFNLGPMLAPCIGPAVGGALSDHLGWRSVFWFLVIMAAVCLLFIVVFLPETMRALVGNGSIRASGAIYQPLIRVAGRHVAMHDPDPQHLQKRKASMNPFSIFCYPDVCMALFFTSIVYSINYTITATISSSFAVTYPYLSETAIGLCYLPTGFGMIVGGTLTGKMLDKEYARFKRKYSDLENPADFPKERARLRTMPIMLAVFTACVFGWGFTIQYAAHLAVPLILQIILGYTSMAILNTTMTLMIDILQSRSSSATACTNFVRCLMATVFVALIERMTATMHYSWAYVFWGCISAAMIIPMMLEMTLGYRWRRKRDLRFQKELEESS